MERSQNKDSRSKSGNRTRNLPHRRPWITDRVNPCTLSNLISNTWSAASEQDGHALATCPEQSGSWFSRAIHSPGQRPVFKTVLLAKKVEKAS